MGSFSPDEYRHEGNAISLLNYHFVFIPKRRKKVLIDAIADRLQELRRQKYVGRGQKGIPINKLRGFDKDTFFLALARREKNPFTFFINKFRGLRPFWQRAKIIFLPPASCPLPSAFLRSSAKFVTKIDGKLLPWKLCLIMFTYF